MADFVAAHHYAVWMPPHCLLSLGCFAGGDLVGVASWGYGVRPRHTIQRLFPSLTTSDYYELNRLCMLDSEPRNGESHFLRLCREYIRQREPGRVVLFAWADGMRGKPGYVYQADNWLYGGFKASGFDLWTSPRRRWALLMRTALPVASFTASHPPWPLAPVMRTGTTLPDTLARYFAPTFTSCFFMTMLLASRASP
jgi:hypothetical protein